MKLLSPKYYQRLAAELVEMDTPMVRWGLVVIVAILFWVVIFEPFLDWKDERMSLLISRSHEVAKLNALKQSSDQWREAMHSYQARFLKRSDKLFQQSAMVSLGKLQQIITGLAKKNHLNIRSRKSYDAVAQPGVGMRLTASFTLTGRTDNIVYFIADIAAWPKFLVIDDLRVVRQYAGKAMLIIRVNGFMLENERE